MRFARTWLGLTLNQFARLVGMRHETVCRWERGDRSSPLTPLAERLLRLLVAQHDIGELYPFHLLAAPTRRKAPPIVLVASDWGAFPHDSPRPASGSQIR